MVLILPTLRSNRMLEYSIHISKKFGQSGNLFLREQCEKLLVKLKILGRLQDAEDAWSMDHLMRKAIGSK